MRTTLSSLFGLVLALQLTVGCSESRSVEDQSASLGATPSSAEVVSATMRITPQDSLSPGSIIHGRLLAAGESGTGGAFAGTTLYLAQVLMAGEDPSGLASMDENNAPSTVVSEYGQFAFVDIEPGLYALIIKTPVSLLVAHDLMVDRDVVFEVGEGNRLDIGDLVVSVPY